jgi:hypothetical protein
VLEYKGVNFTVDINLTQKILTHILHEVDKRVQTIKYLFIYVCMYITIFLFILESIVGTAAGYRMDDGGVGVRVPVGSNFSLLHVIQTGSVVHPTSYPMGTGGSLPGGKEAGE